MDENLKRAKEDRARYDNDVANYMLAKDLPWEWHGSDAERLLKQDVAEGRDLRYHPEMLYFKREEYHEDWGDYQSFRKHFHQEVRAAKEQPYWMVKREKQAKKRKELSDAIAVAKEEQRALEEQEMLEFGTTFAGLSIRF